MNRKLGIAMVAGALMFTATPLLAQQQDDRDRDWPRLRDRDRDRDRDRTERPQDFNLEQVSRVIGMQVETNEGERAGTIQNLAIQPNTGRVVFAVVNPKGHGNLGSQLKAVPFKALTFRDVNQPARLNIDRNRFAQAPPFDPAGWRTMHDPQWKNTVFRHYNIEEDATDRRGDSQQFMQAAVMLDSKLHDRQQQEIGSIDDLMIDLNRGVVVYAITTMDRRERDRMIAVPWPALSDMRETDRVVVVTMERNRLREAPTFARHQELSSARVVERIFTFYGTEPTVIYGYVPVEGGVATDGAGWDHRSEYGRLFESRNIETLQGEIVAIERFSPMRGMSPGVQMRIRSGQDRTVTVHLGPAWYIEQQELNFRQGDNVRCTASRAQFDGQTVYLATEVRRGDQVLLLRDNDGLPRWSATFRVNELATPRGRAVGRDRDRD